MNNSRARQALPLILLLSAVFLLYLRGINGPFLYDDITYVVENPAVQSLDLALRSFGDPTALDAGKFIVVWKQEAGQWKLHRDIFNSSMPAQQ